MREVCYEAAPLYLKQDAAINAPERIAIVEASTKSGKTYGCMDWLLRQAMQGKAGQQFWWVAPVFAQTMDVYNRFKHTAQEQQIPAEVLQFTDGRLEIALGNGTKIVHKSADNADSLYGADVWAAVMDEATRTKEEAWLAIRTTLTATRGPIRIIGNVRGRRNWCFLLARRAESGEPGMHYAKITAYDAIQAGVLDAAEVESAKRDMPERWFRELYLAEPSDDAGNPFGLRAIEACVGPLSPGPIAVWGVDLGKSIDWTVLIALDPEGRTVTWERFQKPWPETIQTITQIVKGTPTLVDSTGLGDPILEQLQREAGSMVEGFKFSAPSKQQLMEGLAVTIQQGGVRYPRSHITQELEAFEYVYSKLGVRYSAPEGLHDDCLLAGTLIKTRDGYRSIEDVRVGDLVLTHLGRWQPVEAVIRKPFAGDMHRFRFRGQLPLDVSYNHPLYAASRSYKGNVSGPWTERQWILPDGWMRSYRAVIPIVKRRTWKTADDDARILGRFLADGHARRPSGTSSQSHGVDIAFSDKDQVGLEYFRRSLQLQGLRPRVETMPGCSRLIWHDRNWWGALRYCYGDNGEKQMPAWGFQARLGLVLEEWLAGDGWRHDKRGLSIGCTTSPALALEMRDIALAEGRAALISQVKAKRYGKPGKLQHWVTVYDGWPVQSRVRRVGNEAIAPLAEHVRYPFEGEVFNLQVAEDRSFVANGIVVHNCVCALALAVRHLYGGGRRDPIKLWGGGL